MFDSQNKDYFTLIASKNSLKSGALNQIFGFLGKSYNSAIGLY